jgi:hypothetical protein
MGHSSWFTYSSMLRVFKTYQLKYVPSSCCGLQCGVPCVCNGALLCASLYVCVFSCPSSSRGSYHHETSLSLTHHPHSHHHMSACFLFLSSRGSYHHDATASRSVSFSSYPGVLSSLDDFYQMHDSGMGMVQTTNGGPSARVGVGAWGTGLGDGAWGLGHGAWGEGR